SEARKGTSAGAGERAPRRGRGGDRGKKGSEPRADSATAGRRGARPPATDGASGRRRRTSRAEAVETTVPARTGQDETPTEAPGANGVGACPECGRPLV